MLNNHILYLHTISETRVTLGSPEITLKTQQLQEDTYLKLDCFSSFWMHFKFSSHPLFT